MLWDVQAHRAKAVEYERKAAVAVDREAREHYLRMAKTSLMLAKNAEWIKSTDEFLRERRGDAPRETPG